LHYILGQRNRPGLKRLVQTLVKVEVPHIDATYTPGQRIGGIEVVPTPGHVSFLSGETPFCGDRVVFNLSFSPIDFCHLLPLQFKRLM